jgi:O-antigen ligase
MGRGRVRSPAAPRLDLLRLVIVVQILCYVWRMQDLFPILTTLKASILSAMGALALVVASPGALRALKRMQHPVMKLTLVMLALVILSVPSSLYPGSSFAFIIDDHLKTMLMMIAILVSVRAFADVQRFAAAQVFGGAIYAGFVIFRLQVGSDGRLGSLFYYDANDLGMMLVCTLPLILYFSRRGSPIIVRVVAWGLGALFLMAIVKTGSRGAFLGLIAVTVFALLTFAAMPVRSRIAVVIAGFMAFSFIATEQYWGMMRTLLNPQDDYNWSGKSESGRMEIWKRGIGYMMDRPLTGVGARQFAMAEGTLSPLAVRQSLGIGVRWAAAHNSFVQIGAELGIPALLVFVAMIVAAFRALGKISRHRPHDDPGRRREAALAQALRASIVGYCVSGFFLSQGYGAYLYAMLAMIAALSAVSRVQPGVHAQRWS